MGFSGLFLLLSFGSVLAVNAKRCRGVFFVGG